MAIAGQQKKLAVDYSKLPVKPAPAQAASVPQLGPPLPGDWGEASTMAPLPNDGAAPGPSAEAVDRQRQAEEIARSSVSFRTSNNVGKRDVISVAAQSIAFRERGMERKSSCRRTGPSHCVPDHIR